MPAGDRAPKVGIKDVSREAGVAISTVSHVLNGTAPISPAVRGRVLEVAGRLGYLARRQAMGTIKTLQTVLIALPPETLAQTSINMVSWTMLRALGAACEQRGIKLEPCPVDSAAGAYRTIVDAIGSAGADGVLLLNVDEPGVLDALAQSEVAAVLLNAEDSQMRLDSVTPGNRFGACLAANWLIGQGHRRILHMTWHGRTTIRRRSEGFLDAFAESGLKRENALFCHATGWEPESGALAMDNWLDEHGGLDGVTAVFCAADNLALGVLQAFAARGISVPGDISVMGFDGIAPGQFAAPSLSTVNIPLDQLGPAALNLLAQRLTGGRDAPRQKLELGCELVIRNSTGQCPNQG
ncbi:MAG: LacI family transcriptional regulator [Alphaproteobacteria bacterium]|nr:LacI family transcriptional regulator [Alphaproteobacteria bacterium]